jgi:hypothetical protein
VPTENSEQRKLAAIMFTDMVGYGALPKRGEPRFQALRGKVRSPSGPTLPYG